MKSNVEKEKPPLQKPQEEARPKTNWLQVEADYPDSSNKDYKDEEIINWWKSVDRQYFVAPEKEQLLLLDTRPLSKDELLQPKENVSSIIE